MARLLIIVVNHVNDPEPVTLSRLGRFDVPSVPHVGEILVWENDEFLVTSVRHEYGYGQTTQVETTYIVTVTHQRKVGSGDSVAEFNKLPWWNGKAPSVYFVPL